MYQKIYSFNLLKGVVGKNSEIVQINVYLFRTEINQAHLQGSVYRFVV